MREGLPKGGPDRTRFCVWYADALDEGKTHEEALDAARLNLNLMRWYIDGGLADKLGPVVGGIPIEFQGEGEST